MHVMGACQQMMQQDNDRKHKKIHQYIKSRISLVYEVVKLMVYVMSTILQTSHNSSFNYCSMI